MYSIIAFFSSSNFHIKNLNFIFFLLKVGGHSSLFQYDKGTICKVLELAELDFYQSMPDSLKKFTPEFRGKRFYNLFCTIIFLILGIITVQYCEDELGYIKLVARSIENETSTNEQDVSSTNDSQSSDNILRNSVQFVLRKVHLFQNKNIKYF